MVELTKEHRVLLLGTGSGAQYFVSQWQENTNIVAVLGTDPSQESFMGYPLVSETEHEGYQYDYIVIASWAIKQIALRLLKLAVSPENILWYQNHKNVLVTYSEVGDLQYTREKLPEDTLFAFYDLNCARTTFDIMGFLCLADIEREKQGLEWVHLVIANASDNEFNQQMQGIINSSDHNWRKQQILTQTAGLLPSLSGYSVTSHRSELFHYCQNKHVFPEAYSPEQPIASFEFDLLFEAVEQGHSIHRLQASENASQIVQRQINHLSGGKPIVVITLRQSTIQPARNSLIEEWQAFAQYLVTRGYYVVIVPDTEQISSSHWQEENVYVYIEACFNVEIRMALYQEAFVNLGVNNGPMHLCVVSDKCKYIMFKQIVNAYPHSSEASFKKRKFTIGGDFPGAIPGQYLCWHDDNYDDLVKSFEQHENTLRDANQSPFQQSQVESDNVKRLRPNAQEYQKIC